MPSTKIAFASLVVLLALHSLASAQPPTPPTLNFDYTPPKAMLSAPIVQAQAPAPPNFIDDAAGGLLPVAVPTPPPKIWSGGGEIGTNGASGNSELFNLRVGLNANRKTQDNLFTGSFLYTYANQSKIITQNQMLLNARDEILFVGSPWSLFAATNIEYDELRAYRFRSGFYAGVGYQVIDSETTNLRVRAGAGAVYETSGRSGGPMSRWVPELVFGTDFNHKFSDRQSIETAMDYYPRIDDFSQFRLRSRVAYVLLLDKDNGITLRLGAQNRYDSNPGNARANDLTYYASLGFSF